MEAAGKNELIGEIAMEYPMLALSMLGYAGEVGDIDVTLPGMELVMEAWQEVKGDIADELPLISLLLNASQGGRFDSFVMQYNEDTGSCQ